MTRAEYIADPCRASSLPYWKTVSIRIPGEIRIVHHSQWREEDCEDYVDTPYFRLRHDLRHIPRGILPRGYVLGEASCEEFSAHIRWCYEKTGVSPVELERLQTLPVYEPTLWLAVRDEERGSIAASAIGDLDRETGEGILEWIQVSPDCRRQGLGRYLVLELLGRMAGKAAFATVSGQEYNPFCPEMLYRQCGFCGNDIWHILTKKTLPSGNNE